MRGPIEDNLKQPDKESVQPAYPVDLQVHSTRSDGTDSPAELVRLAVQAGVRVLALTDHDSVLGVDAAISAGRVQGVTVVPALEFSTMSERERDLLDVNILAYGIDHRHADLAAMLDRIIENRIEQKIRQIERLQAYGVDVPVAAVLASASGVPGRVHIAKIALERNPHRFDSINDVFTQYLAADAPDSTYVARAFSLRVEEAIDLTHAAAGIAVLAHPGSYTRIRGIAGVVKRLAHAGLDGLEVSYTYARNRGHHGAAPDHVAAMIAGFDRLADECRLLKSGGSDYHGTAKPGISIGQAGLTEAGWVRLAPYLTHVYTPNDHRS